MENVEMVRGTPVPVRHRIKEIRMARFLTQSQLAKAAGIRRDTLALYENGDKEPRPGTMHKIATALGLNPPWLIYHLPADIQDALTRTPACPANDTTTDDDHDGPATE